MSIPSAQETKVEETNAGGERVLNSLASIVEDYIELYGMKKAQELAYYVNLADLDEVIEVVSRFQAPNGKCQPRQCGIPRESKDEVQASLGSKPLESPKNFVELEATVRERIGHIRGIGDMTIYDTALRIGAFLGVLPQEVYLHGSARDGALALRLDANGRTLPVKSMPREFNVLESWELEDCLGIYKDDLERIQGQPKAA